MKVSHGKVQDEQVPLQLTSVCWAAQTPAGCFKSKCRYLHVPISRRHRCWIQLWGFVWWHQRMFDDLNSLIQCALAALVVIAWEAGHLAETYKDTYKVKWRFPRFLQNLQDESVVTVRAGSSCSISQTTPATSTCFPRNARIEQTVKVRFFCGKTRNCPFW